MALMNKYAIIQTATFKRDLKRIKKEGTSYHYYLSFFFIFRFPLLGEFPAHRESLFSWFCANRGVI